METVEKYNGSVNLTDADIKTLVEANIIPTGTPKAQVAVFARTCGERNLSPFSKQIYLMSRQTKQGMRYTTQTSIDGFRSISERTNKYAGSDDYVFDEGISEYQMIKDKRLRPTTATATVHKILPNQQIFPIKATVRWEEYYPGGTQGFMWDKMPFLMLGKCAEALALRKAFPEQLGSIYISEEMQQAENTVVETQAEVIEQPKEVEPPVENLTDKYEAMFKGKTPAEIKEVYNHLPIKDKGKEKPAYKIAMFYKEEYENKNSVVPQNGKDEILTLINKVTPKTNIDSLSKIDSLLDGVDDLEKRRGYLAIFNEQIKKCGIEYESTVLLF